MRPWRSRTNSPAVCANSARGSLSLTMSLSGDSHMATLTRGSLSQRPAPTPRVIVVGNEKGGAGKSTIAIHLATALLHAGSKVATIDLDLRQLSLAHFFSNRRTWSASAKVELPMPRQYLADQAQELLKMPAPDAVAAFEAAGTEALQGADFLIV